MYKSPIETILGEVQTKYDNEVMKAVQKVGINVDKDELIKALEYDRGQYKQGYEDGKRESCKEILRTLIMYNHDVEYFEDFADVLESQDGNMCIPFSSVFNDNELHTIFEILVILFGDWGTSVRSGWIEDTKGCAKFIRECIEGLGKSEVFNESKRIKRKTT